MSERELSAERPAPSLGRRVVSALLLAVAVFALLSIAGDVRALGHSLATFDLTALWAALGLVLCNYALRFLRWQYYLRRLSVRVDAGLSFLIFLSGFVMSVTPGKMGEVLKSLLLFEYRGVAVSRTVSAVVVERLLDLVALVLLVSMAGIGFPHGRMIALAGASVVLCLVLVCTVRPFGEWWIDRIESWRAVAALGSRLRAAYTVLQGLMRPRPFAVGLVFGTLGWALECAASYCVIRGFSGAAMDLAGASFGYAAGTLAGALAMLPGGLGVAELGMSGLFRLASPTLPLATAAAATILIRLCTLWFGVALGGIALLTLRAYADKHLPQRGN